VQLLRAPHRPPPASAAGQPLRSPVPVLHSRKRFYEKSEKEREKVTIKSEKRVKGVNIRKTIFVSFLMNMNPK
jgi:hypothetical protein